MRKYPALLPGKELGAAHFEPFTAAELSETQLAEALAPLWKLATERRWAEKGLIDAAQEKCAKKQTKEAWDIAQGWGVKINWTQPQESHAAAGWILLRNLDRARQIWKGFRRPYYGLRQATVKEFQRALQLACAFEKNLPEADREGERHLLALTILLLERKDLDALGRETLGATSMRTAAQGTDKLLVVTHGLLTAEGNKWVRADLETIRALAARLEKSLSKSQQRGITAWRQRLSEGTTA
jgi:hypothetical protein